MSQLPCPQHDKDAWRDFLLQQLVVFLGENRDEIVSRFLKTHPGTLTEEDIQNYNLMDFDLSITLHCDKRSTLGLGLGFFKANLIR